MTSQLLIKLVLISGMVAVVAFAMRGNGSTNQALRRLGGLGFAAVAVVSILWPDIIAWLANRLGVARGPDLVLYALVVVFLFVSVALYQRIHLLETRLSRVTRALAIATADQQREPTESAP